MRAPGESVLPGANLAAAERFLAGAGPAELGAQFVPPARRGPRLHRGAPLWRRLGRWAKSWLGGWLERGRPQPKSLSICERLDLGPKKSLAVVAYEGRRFLIGCGPESVEAIHEISPGAPDRERIPVVIPARWSEE